MNPPINNSRLWSSVNGSAMVKQYLDNNKNGFTLFEILAVMMVLSVLTIISINLFNSVDARGHLYETEDRLELIKAKIKRFYETHEELPDPVDPDGAGPAEADDVPVQADALDMEQRYRMDAWGHYLQYYRGSTITEYDVNGQTAAGVLISLGPNQVQDFINLPANPTVFTSAGDDLLVPIIVTAEAKTITLKRLKAIQEKVDAYDALFSGIDNNGDGGVDNTADVGDAAVLNDDNTCPPTNSFDNDPSEGLSTLDAIEIGTVAYGPTCTAPLINKIVAFYGLPDTYVTDAWNQGFLWGYEGRLRDDGSPIETSDRRYHRFYSSGPDNTDVQDDITYNGE